MKCSGCRRFRTTSAYPVILSDAKDLSNPSHLQRSFAAKNATLDDNAFGFLCVTLSALWFILFESTQRIAIMREIISTKDAPQAIGPYSQAIKANGLIFTSGQIAIDPATQQVITGDVAAQTDRVLRNLSEILEAAGSGLGKVVRSTVFLKNMSDFAAMNGVYGKYFSTAPPARSTVEVARLPKDVLVEIDVIALE